MTTYSVLKQISKILHHSALSVAVTLLFVTFTYGSTNRDPVLNAEVQQWKTAQLFLGFQENKGQMTDMEGNPVPYVLYKVSSPGLDIFVTTQGLTYSFLKIEESEEDKFDNNDIHKDGLRTEWRRVDMFFKNASILKENIITEGNITNGKTDHYKGHCPDGIFGIKTFTKITIKQVYPGIDWTLYTSKDGGLKHDLIIHPGANAKLIKLIYEGSGKLNVKEDQIKISTKIGDVSEGKLVCYQNNECNKVESSYTIKQTSKRIENGFSYEVGIKLASYDMDETLVIDPQLTWCTMIGGNNWEGINSVDVDGAGNVYASCYVYSTDIPMLGAYQGVNNGKYDASILKFSNTGTLLQSTYFGGTENDICVSIAIDNTGNIFLTGITASANLPVLNAGTYFDNTLGGTNDCFVLKFNAAFILQWSTYFGGDNGIDDGRSIDTDAAGNLFLGGATWSSVNFPSLNAGTYFDNTLNGTTDGFISKFTNAGALLWSTYYGGSLVDVVNAITIDINNNLFIAGETTSTNYPVLNPGGGAHFQGGYNGWSSPACTFYASNFWGDGVIAKFSNTGTQIWSTYYGGSSMDRALNITSDLFGNIFVSGITTSANLPLLNAGAYFDNILGCMDGFILKFNGATCARTWATFFGGSDLEFQTNDYDRLATDNCGNLYATFNSGSMNTPTLSNSCDYKDNSCGGCGTGIVFGDVVITKFSPTTSLLWSTFFGDVSTQDFRGALTVDNNNDLFVGGEFPLYTTGTAGLPLVNPGGGAYFDNTFHASDDAFIAKFIRVLPTVTKSQTNNTTCAPCNGSATVNLTCSEPNYNYTWSNGNTTLNSTSTTNTANGLCPGTYTVTVTSNCNQTQTTTFAITGTTCGGITATATSAVTCPGTACPPLTSSGVSGTTPYTYLWSTGASTQNINPCPLSNTTYTVTITDAVGSTATATASVSINPLITITITPTNTTCNETTNGSAQTSTAGGTAPYTYSWSNGGTTSQISNLISQTYTVTVTDSKGCTTVSTAAITSPPPLSGLFTKGTANCTGCGCKEWVMVSSSGGTSPYSYFWPDGYLNRYKNQLCPGSYLINIKDKNGCSLNINLTTP
ncbi:MAG: SBBP repeat-containing protein [Bacteroidetes bacterium]|nr:SBBP repeat-containing protein [Bacteroidota bacterium]